MDTDNQKPYWHVSGTYRCLIVHKKGINNQWTGRAVGKASTWHSHQELPVTGAGTGRMRKEGRDILGNRLIPKMTPWMHKQLPVFKGSWAKRRITSQSVQSNTPVPNPISGLKSPYMPTSYVNTVRWNTQTHIYREIKISPNHQLLGIKKWVISSELNTENDSTS